MTVKNSAGALPTYKELRLMYGVSMPTFRKWLSKIPGLKENSSQRISRLNPKQIEKIYEHLGKPEQVEAT